MNGFLVRVAAQADKAARDVQRIAEQLDAAVNPDVRVLHHVVAHLKSLAQTVATAREPTPAVYERIANDSDTAYRAVSQCALQLRITLSSRSDAQLSYELEAIARVLGRINHDALADTQPISWPRKVVEPD